MKHKLTVPIIALITVLAIYFVLTPSSAFAASHAASVPKHQATTRLQARSFSPAWSGGGCSSFVKYGPNYANASYQSCISGELNEILPDAYITFTAQTPSLWSSCHITIKLRDDTVKNTVTAVTYDCTPSARKNAYYMHYDGTAYFPPGGHAFHTYVYWNGAYNGQTINGGTVNSPELYS